MLLESAELFPLFDSELKITEVQAKGSFSFEELFFRGKAKVSIRASYKNQLLEVEIDSVQSPSVVAKDLPIDWRPFITEEDIKQTQQNVILELQKEDNERLLELEEVVVKAKKNEGIFGLKTYKPAQTVREETLQVYAGLSNELAYKRLVLQYVRPGVTDIVKISIDGNILPIEYLAGINFINIAKVDVYRGPDIMGTGGTILVDFVTKKAAYMPTVAYSVSFIKKGFE